MSEVTLANAFTTAPLILELNLSDAHRGAVGSRQSIKIFSARRCELSNP